MNKVRLLSFIFCVGIISGPLLSQSVAGDTGKVEIIQDYKISDLLQKHKDLNSKSLIKGYRVKIHFGNDKAEAIAIKEKFNEQFPDIPAYVRYDQPYFSVRVGDYRTKLEAYKFLKQIQSEYVAAFLVQDDIELIK